MRIYHRHTNRTGSILVLSALFIVFSLVVVAFAIDLGYVQMVAGQMQRTADASAIAAASTLLDQNQQLSTNASLTAGNTLGSARTYAAFNTVSGSPPALADADITLGYLANPSDPSQPLDTSDPTRLNTVQIRVRKTADQNGAVPFFFARVLGMNGIDEQTTATASFLSNISGFSTPSDGSNLAILPFALDQETWDNLLAGIGSDDWTWSDHCNRILCGSDGVLEVNLFPQGTGSPGNRGTVDIGNSSNSTADLKRQIVEGINAADMESLGGRLQFNDQGELYLNGDTGISAGMKAELASIKGQPRIIPIFKSVSGNGNNATYTIVKWAGVRIMDVNLTGSMSSKRLIVQPAKVFVRGGIPALGDQVSNYLYSRVWLVR